MNVVVGDAVNAIREVNESQESEEEEVSEDTQIQLHRKIASLRKQLAHVEGLLAQQETQKQWYLEATKSWLLVLGCRFGTFLVRFRPSASI